VPNKSAAFYRWVFLEAFPLLLGQVNLGRIVLFLSDVDSQEFNAIDEGIFQYFKEAQRGRCLCLSHCPKDLESYVSKRRLFLGSN
jgi:hypothetical protein